MAASQTEILRLDVLARPKRLPTEYRDDRRSVYWVEREPLRGGPDGHTVFIATPRVSDLARHKTCVDTWRPHRPSSIWPVSEPAMSASASVRLTQLSRHRDPHPSYGFDRNPEWEVRESAKSAMASNRLEQLSAPKSRLDTSYIDPYWGFRDPVSENALHGKCSERLDLLAQHKEFNKAFRGEKPVQWEVSKEAIGAIASLRLQQLARPRSRTMIQFDYDPYKIPPSAMKARATPRIDELAVPLPRKSRSKKV